MFVRPTEAVVDLDAIVHNVRIAQRYARGSALCAVIKANAYGHGAVDVARALKQAQVPWLAVALVEEGFALRQAGTQGPILVLAGNYQHAWQQVIALGLTPTISSMQDVAQFAQVLGSATLEVHLEVDTGMRRLGIDLDALPAFLTQMQRYPQLRITGLMSHLSHADKPDAPQNQAQWQQMLAAEAQVQRAGHKLVWRHMLNSGGLVCMQQQPPKELVRCGLMLYGDQPCVGFAYPDLRPAMTWRTRPVMLRDIPEDCAVSYGARWTSHRPSRIATLPVGYADGYRRAFGNRGHVLIRGQKAPVLGSVCMDMCMVDVTDIPDVTLDDEVVLLGTQKQATITADDLATWSDSLSYEMLCGIAARVPRRYVGME